MGMTRREALALLGTGALASIILPLDQLPAPSAAPMIRPASLDDRAKEQLQMLFEALCRRAEVHEAVLFVETGDGTRRWSASTVNRSAGDVPHAAAALPASALKEADAESDPPVFLASITKLYTAACVLRLVERSVLRLDDAVVDLLPDALTRGLHRMKGVDYTASLRVHHLLNHTSGLADYFSDRPRGGRSLSDLILNEGDRAWTIADVAERVRSDLTPHFVPQTPGEQRPCIRYSDTNYQLLGAIIEAVEALPLHEVLYRELFMPLGLERTYLHPHKKSARVERPAPIWVDDEPRNFPLAMASFKADGGIVAPLSEATAFLRALVHGTVFEHPGTRVQMEARWIRFGLPLDPVALQLPSWPVEYGRGIMRFQIPSLLNGFRRMPPLVGHTGSTGSWLFYCRELDVLLAGTVNQASAGALPYRFVPKLLRALT